MENLGQGQPGCACFWPTGPVQPFARLTNCTATSLLFQVNRSQPDGFRSVVAGRPLVPDHLGPNCHQPFCFKTDGFLLNCFRSNPFWAKWSSADEPQPICRPSKRFALRALRSEPPGLWPLTPVCPLTSVQHDVRPGGEEEAGAVHGAGQREAADAQRPRVRAGQEAAGGEHVLREALLQVVHQPVVRGEPHWPPAAA